MPDSCPNALKKFCSLKEYIQDLVKSWGLFHLSLATCKAGTFCKPITSFSSVINKRSSSAKLTPLVPFLCWGWREHILQIQTACLASDAQRCPVPALLGFRYPKSTFVTLREPLHNQHLPRCSCSSWKGAVIRALSL